MESSDANEFDAKIAAILRDLQHGDVAEAAQQAEQALQSHPDEPNLLRLLGISLLRQGDFSKAAVQLATSVEIDPTSAGGQEHYGLALAAVGRVDEAETALKSAVELDPKSETALMKLSRLYMMLGREDDVQATQQRMFALNPQWSKLHEAMKLQNDGDFPEARKKIKEVLREDPDNVNALNLMGSVCVALDAHNDAEAFFLKAVRLAPDFAVAWAALSIALKEQGKFEDAVDAMQKALALEPANADWHSNLGNLLLAWGKEEQALQAFERALDMNPEQASALLSKGHALKTIGDQDEAIEAYRAAARARPDLGEIYWSLANLKTFRFEPDEVESMRSQLDSGELTEDSQLNFCYSLGKHFEDLGDYPTAFEYYMRGGSIKRGLVSHDPTSFDAQADRIIEVFTPEFFEERASFGHSDDSPILIVGLPRSGSTLIEQILCSHSKVDGTAELSDLMTLAHQTGLNRFDNLKFPESLLDMYEDSFEDLGIEYIERTAHHRQGAPFFTDKMPNNFPCIGFLHLILPNAKVIDARRHPLDSCFGSFKQLFAKGQRFSYDLFDLGQYYKSYVRLMEHWDRVLPGKVLRVQYEDNVADTETQARRMIEHCGLEWEDQVLRFYETERAVKTASSEQVRQPIYSKSVNSWKRYESELAVLILMLEDELNSLPDHLDRPNIPAQ